MYKNESKWRDFKVVQREVKNEGVTEISVELTAHDGVKVAHLDLRLGPAERFGNVAFLHPMGPVGYIDYLKVEEPFRRHGIGTYLIKKASAIVADREHWEVFVHADVDATGTTSDPRPFYERNGYIPAGTDTLGRFFMRRRSQGITDVHAWYEVS
jgi:GNAT superfamily N-acetyltransferase